MDSFFNLVSFRIGSTCQAAAQLHLVTMIKVSYFKQSTHDISDSSTFVNLIPAKLATLLNYSISLTLHLPCDFFYAELCTEL